MAERIAIVEDERLVRELVAVNLRHAGYEILTAENFEEGRKLLSAGDYQLAILDVMLPGGDGFALTRHARDIGISAPILMLTARTDTSSKVRGLDAGADDYLPKPFDVNELLARVRALLRRASGRPASAPPRLVFANFWVRFDTGQALTNEGEVSLSDKELRLMEVFSANENRALTRADLLEEVWGMDQFPTDRTVDNFILRLRKLFEPDPENPVHIVTLRGRGVSFQERAVSSTTARVTPIGAPEIAAAREYFTGLHTRLGDAWAALDPASPQRRDQWTRPVGDVLSGNGRLSLIELGATFDRAGVAFSDVSGAKLPAAASERHTELAGQPFRAMGTSVVVHPVNPYAPTSHANVRLFTARGGEMWWFGGGFDLTPVYPFDEDARAWHQAAKAACDPAGPRAYPLLKQACDSYFFLPHRGETRGIGGLFADDLNDAHGDLGGDFEHCFALIRRIGDAYLDAYVKLVKLRRDTPYGEREQAFQRLRRGRYVEFNLAFDRGTRFGLQSSARTESLLMSLPPRAEWRYDYLPEPGSPESRLADYLKPRDWL